MLPAGIINYPGSMVKSWTVTGNENKISKIIFVNSNFVLIFFKNSYFLFLKTSTTIKYRSWIYYSGYATWHKEKITKI